MPVLIPSLFTKNHVTGFKRSHVHTGWLGWRLWQGLALRRHLLNGGPVLLVLAHGSAHSAPRTAPQRKARPYSLSENEQDEVNPLGFCPVRNAGRAWTLVPSEHPIIDSGILTPVVVITGILLLRFHQMSMGCFMPGIGLGSRSL